MRCKRDVEQARRGYDHTVYIDHPPLTKINPDDNEHEVAALVHPERVYTVLKPGIECGHFWPIL